MTNNDDDRRAAADVVFDAMKGGLNWMHAKGCIARILAGEWDNHPTVAAFTAHRIAAERRGIERAAEVAEEHACQHCAHISTAIRSLTEGE